MKRYLGYWESQPGENGMGYSHPVEWGVSCRFFQAIRRSFECIQNLTGSYWKSLDRRMVLPINSVFERFFWVCQEKWVKRMTRIKAKRQDAQRKLRVPGAGWKILLMSICGHLSNSIFKPGHKNEVSISRFPPPNYPRGISISRQQSLRKNQKVRMTVVQVYLSSKKIICLFLAMLCLWGCLNFL